MGDDFDDLLSWRPPVRRDDPQTSADAAADLDPSKIYAAVVATMKGRNSGWIIDELSEASGIDRQTLSPRMTEMEDKMLVHRVRLGTSPKGRAIYQKRPGNSNKGQQEWFLGPSTTAAMSNESLTAPPSAENATVA